MIIADNRDQATLIHLCCDSFVDQLSSVWWISSHCVREWLNSVGWFATCGCFILVGICCWKCLLSLGWRCELQHHVIMTMLWHHCMPVRASRRQLRVFLGGRRQAAHFVAHSLSQICLWDDLFSLCNDLILRSSIFWKWLSLPIFYAFLHCDVFSFSVSVSDISTSPVFFLADVVVVVESPQIPENDTQKY